MALTFWGWNGNRDVVGKVVKPSDKDKNVMPYEFQDFITDNVPGMTSAIRYGGDIDMLKRMVTAGFPVVVEKGIYERDINGNMGWMGHYAFVTGYDETKQEIIYQDTYQPEPKTNPGPNRHIKYSTFNEGWRAFDYVFTVVYPTDKESQVMALLGPLADEEQAPRHALEVAQSEAQSLSDIDQFFAWFNVGTSHVALLEYVDAATAYDYAVRSICQSHRGGFGPSLSHDVVPDWSLQSVLLQQPLFGCDQPCGYNLERDYCRAGS